MLYEVITIVVIKPNSSKQQIDNLIDWIKAQNFEVHISEGKYQTILGLIGDTSRLDTELLEELEIVETVKRITEPFKNANRKFHSGVV